MLFSSSGGLVEEGLSLHHFLRALPVNLVMHCVGSADSIAMVVFLAGHERYCCADSTFLFHDFGWGSQTAVNFTRVQFLEFHASLESFKVRSQQLLKTRAAFTDADFAALGLYDKASIYDAAFAKSKGIVHDIKDAQVPSGGPVFNIDF
jgi:ATP-dependent protease ClpP protease subunit